MIYDRPKQEWIINIISKQVAKPMNKSNNSYRQYQKCNWQWQQSNSHLQQQPQPQKQQTSRQKQWQSLNQDENKEYSQYNDRNLNGKDQIENEIQNLQQFKYQHLNMTNRNNNNNNNMYTHNNPWFNGYQVWKGCSSLLSKT